MPLSVRKVHDIKLRKDKEVKKDGKLPEYRSNKKVTTIKNRSKYLTRLLNRWSNIFEESNKRISEELCKHLRRRVCMLANTLNGYLLLALI